MENTSSIARNQGILINNQGEEDSLYKQLWLACAGPNVYLPSCGDKVYYFPQGHLEQVHAHMKNDDPVEMPIYNLPPKILCQVANIYLMAETNTDEVYAQVTLLPYCGDEVLLNPNETDYLTQPKRSKARSYSKRLTPSDSSTHGGFSIPKRCADEIFPTLDMSQEIPSGELVAKDLHGCTWKFRHIYRGYPKRHLLTSGWSSFITTKKLVAGDTAIFLRGENGEVHVGINRARKLKNMTPASVLSSISMRHGILATAYDAMSNGAIFNVNYWPWTDPAQFIVPYDQYMKSAEIDYSVGTRFRMLLETVERTEYIKFAGTITGIEDIDSIRWPNSEWRQFKVEWDATSDMCARPVRVSPWSIEPIGVIKKKNVPIILNPKRPRPIDPSAPYLPFVINDGLLKNHKERHMGVLQGQEAKATDSHELVSASTEANGNGKKIKLFGVDLFNSSSEYSSPQASLSNPSTPFNTSPTPSLSAISKVQSTKRSCTKVFMYGSALGRSIDLTICKDYSELLKELDRLFELNGGLVNGSYRWRVSYTNIKGDELRLGDCHWRDFKVVVQKMFICPKGDGDKVDLI